MLGEPAVSIVSNCVSGTDSVDSTCSVEWRPLTAAAQHSFASKAMGRSSATACCL